MKTLTDPDAASVNFTPKRATVDALRKIPTPGVGRADPRIEGVETTTYQVRVQPFLNDIVAPPRLTRCRTACPVPPLRRSVDCSRWLERTGFEAQVSATAGLVSGTSSRLTIDAE